MLLVELQSGASASTGHSMAPTQISTDAEQMWQVELLRRQFLQLVDPNELAIPGSETLRSPDLQARIYNSMFNEANHRVSPPDRYKFRVLKKLVAAMERAIVDPEEDVGFPYLLSSVIGTFLLYEKTLATAVHQSFKETDIKAPQRFQEISDDLTSCLAELLAQPFASESEAAEQKSYVTYSAPTRTLDAPVIRLLEARSLLASSGTTGLRTWEAALFLGAYLYSAAGQDLIRGNSVLELGAGTGFLSILCAKHLGARNTLATDGSREVITDMQTNLSLNGLDCGNLLDTATFLWGHALVGSVLDMNQNTRRYDVVLGADVVSHRYSRKLSYRTFCLRRILRSINTLHVSYMIDRRVSCLRCEWLLPLHSRSRAHGC